MLKAMQKTIRQYNMLAPGDKVLVGFSGGADSVVLLSALMALREEWGISLCAAHINHNLRSAAGHDEEFARLFCDERDIPLAVFQADVAGFAASEKLGTEEAGRVLRYKYLHEGLAKFGAAKIALGHHADDNAETILLSLFRGAGLKGLCGIPPVNGQIIRPLLEVSRENIEAYAHENGLKYVIDETNNESDYSRNYIRNKIMPAVHEHFGGGVAATMTRNALWMREDEEFLSAATKEAYYKLTGAACPAYGVPPSAHKITFPINELLSQPPAITGRIIRHAITILRVEALKDIQSTHIQSILDIAQGETGREAHLPGFIAKREYADLILSLPAYDAQTDFNYPLYPDIPVNTSTISAVLTLQSPKKLAKSHCTQAFNYDKVDGVLELRTRRPGDKIALAGTGTKKLQDYFTDTKTPKSQRDQIPLLADGSNILWIMDKHNRTGAAYEPAQGHATCWVTVYKKEGTKT